METFQKGETTALLFTAVEIYTVKSITPLFQQAYFRNKNHYYCLQRYCKVKFPLTCGWADKTAGYFILICHPVYLCKEKKWGARTILFITGYKTENLEQL